MNNVTKLEDCFEGCTSLKAIPPDLFVNMDIETVSDIYKKRLGRLRNKEMLKKRLDKINRIEKKIRRKKILKKFGL